MTDNEQLINFIKTSLVKNKPHEYTLETYNNLISRNSMFYFHSTDLYNNDDRHLFTWNLLCNLKYNDESITYKTIILLTCLLNIAAEYGYKHVKCIISNNNVYIISKIIMVVDSYILFNLTDENDDIVIIPKSDLIWECNLENYLRNGIKNLKIPKIFYRVKKELLRQYNPNMFKSKYRDILYLFYILELSSVMGNSYSPFFQYNQNIYNIIKNIRELRYSYRNCNCIERVTVENYVDPQELRSEPNSIDIGLTNYKNDLGSMFK